MERNGDEVCKGIVKGNTISLDEKPDLPEECRVLVEIKPVDEARDEEIARRHIALLKKAPRVGKLLYKKREELYDRELRLIDANVLVHALLFPKC
jgi:hypothetical protein